MRNIFFDERSDVRRPFSRRSAGAGRDSDRSARSNGRNCAAHQENSEPRFLLSAIRQMKFFRAVRPEEKILLRARKLGEVGELLQFEVEAVVEWQAGRAGQLVFNALSPKRSR